MLFDRLGYDLEHNGRWVDQLEDTDGLDVVLDNQKSNHARQKETSLELILDFLREVGVQVSRIQGHLKVIDSRQGVREVLHEREYLRGTQSHKFC